MAELLADAGGASEVRAVVAHGTLVAHDRRRAHRTDGRHLVFALVARALAREGANDLRDDVAGLLEHDVVPDPDVLPSDLVEVVERRPRDRRAGDLGRLQVGDRRQRSGPADVRDDVLDDGLDLLGRELEGDRPARGTAHHAEPLLLIESIDLDDDAVRLIRQVVALLAPILGEHDHGLDVEPGPAIRVDREAESREPIERRRLAIATSAGPSSSISW